MIKIFGASSYDDLVWYWISMSEDSNEGKCLPTKIIGEYRKSSRMRCTYRYLYSYNTIIASRVGDDAFIVTDVMYSNTTNKQVNSLVHILMKEGKDYTFASAPVCVITLSYMIRTMHDKMRSLRKIQKTIEKSRKSSTRNSRIVKFNRILNTAIRIMEFYYKSHKRPAEGKDIDIARDIKYDSNIDDAEKKLISLYNKRIRDSRYRTKIANAKKIYPDFKEMKLITSSNKKIDIVSLAIMSGQIKMPFNIDNTGNFREKTISNKRYYEYNNELIDSEVADKIITIYYKKISNKVKNEYT